MPYGRRVEQLRRVRGAVVPGGLVRVLSFVLFFFLPGIDLLHHFYHRVVAFVGCFLVSPLWDSILMTRTVYQVSSSIGVGMPSHFFVS